MIGAYSAVFLVLGPVMVAAQEGPTQTVQAAFAALAQRDWLALANIVDPTRLEKFRQEELGFILLWARQKDSIAEAKRQERPWSLSGRDSVSPETVAKVGHVQVPAFPGSPTVAQLAAIPPAEFFARWCGVAYGADAERDPVQEVVGLERRTIGQVLEGDTMAHVLYRRESRHVDMDELKIDLPGRVMEMPLKRSGRRWLLLLNDDLGRAWDLLGLFQESHGYRLGTSRQTTRAAPTTPTPPNPEAVKARPGPTETVQAAFGAFERRDWQALASLVHPDRLASFQSEQVAYLIAWTGSKEARAQATREGAAFMMSYDDSLSSDAMATVADVKVEAFSHGATIGELARLSPSAFFTRWCEAAYGANPKKGPGQVKLGLKREVIGEMFEDDTLAHVLYRTDLWYSVRRMPLKYSSAGWRLLLNDDIGWSIDLSMVLAGS